MLVANGRNHTEAYRDAYQTEHMGDNSVHREAYRLTQNPKVATRIDELKDQSSRSAGIVSQLEEKIADLAKQVNHYNAFVREMDHQLQLNYHEMDEDVKRNAEMLTEIYDALTDPDTTYKRRRPPPYAPRNSIRTTPLTLEQIENAEPRDKKYKLFDGNGLHLVVYTTGRKTWALNYSIGGRKRTVTIGRHPDIDMETARSRKEEILAYLKEAKDPFELGAKWRKRLERKKAREQKALEEKPVFISRNQPIEDVAAPKNSSKKQQDQAVRWGASGSREVSEIVREVAKKAPEKKPEKKKEKKKTSRDSDYSHLASLRYSDLENGLMGRLCLSLVKSCGADKRYASERFRLQAAQGLDLFRDDKTIGQIRMMQPREFEKTGEVRLLTYMGIASRLCKAILLLGTQQERAWLVDVDTEGQPRSLRERRLLG
jgi:hypothetical protein